MYKIKLNILMLSGCFFINMLCLTLSSKAQNWDIDLLNKINPPNPQSFIWKSTSASTYPICVGVPLFEIVYGHMQHQKDLKEAGFKTLGSLAVNTLLTQTLKRTINRQRPSESYTFISAATIEKDASFPSGHTSSAFALATSVSLQTKKWYIIVPAYGWATAVGYSRLYLGEHYPTDVLAGAVLGTASSLFTHWAIKKWIQRAKQPSHTASKL